MNKCCSKCGVETEDNGDIHCRKILVSNVKQLLNADRIEEAKSLVLRTRGDRNWEEWKDEMFARFSFELAKRPNKLKREKVYKKEQHEKSNNDAPFLSYLNDAENIMERQEKRQFYKHVYNFYIDSHIWKNKKITLSNIYKLNNWPIECLRCGVAESLRCHHNYYIGIKYLGCENLSDIDYLCKKCHDAWHYIQKTSNSSQNKMFNQYYGFIFESQEYSNFSKILDLLLKKNNMDDVEISNYFLQENVIKYKKLNNVAVSMLFISIILAILPPVFWIGIITMVITFLIFSKNKKPRDYDLYEERNIPVEKRKILFEKLSVIN